MSNINVDKALLEKVAVHENISQEIIVISTDKIKLILIEHHRLVKKSNDWVGPVGIFITILLTILTANFTETRLGIVPQVWQGVFILACIISFVWSTVVAINAFIIRSKATIDSCLTNLKASSSNN